MLSAANTGGLDNDAEIQLGQLRIFPAQFQASYASVPLELTNLEFRLLTLFSRNPGPGAQSRAHLATGVGWKSARVNH
ncbi:MAG: hypothetical protein GEU68_00130 [Actinobacteria bacterium]|nr:hypothetical protein [Actinomycetota bacterium]